jgi:DDE family transposase
LEATSEEVHDGRMLKNLVDKASENNNVKRVADGMYDSNNNFRYLSKKRIKPGMKTRSNSKVKSTTNCHSRNMSVIRHQTNLKGWKRRVN